MSLSGPWPQDSFQELRKRAKDNAGKNASGEVKAPSRDEGLALLEELRIHQIELEMQNEELRHAQAALEDSRARYFDLYDLAPVGYLTVDDSGTILEANLCAANLLAVTPHSRLKGWRFLKSVVSGDEDTYYLARKRMAQTGARQVCELRLQRTDGVAFWARLEMGVSHYDAAPVCRIVIIDISERKLAEHRFDTFMEHSPASASIVDEEGCYVYLNPAMQRHTGAGTQSWVGKSFFEVWPPDEAHRLRERHERTLANNRVTAENEAVQLGHQERVHQVLRFPFAGPNGKKLVGSVSIDVTDRLRNVSLAAEKNLAEEATRAKSQFLSAMSHEIRTPLNGVIGMAGLLLHTDLTAEQISYARIVSDSAEALLALVNDILDFSKIEAGKLALEESPFDLECLVEDVLSLMSFKAHEKSLELAAWYPHGAPRRFLGDAGRLRQILMNFLSNAVKFTHGGYVLAEVDASEPLEGRSSVRIAIHDTGIGISQKSQARLFDTFSQADPTIARRFGGSGLGLSIVKQVVELMGGEVGVNSVEGAGSTFYCRLPLRVDPGPPVAPLEDDNLLGVAVLVTGGQFIGRFVVSELCQRWGMKVEQCDLPNLPASLSGAAKIGRPFQFVIVDGSLAALTEGILNVQLNGGGHPPKLILITSDPWERAKSLKADAVLPTPVRANILREKLVDLVRGIPVQPFRANFSMPANGTISLGKVLGD